MENFRYHLWAGEIISSISYLNNLQNICFDLHFNEAKIIYFKYPFNLHFKVIFIFNSVCIKRYCPLIAHSLPTHCPLISHPSATALRTDRISIAWMIPDSTGTQTCISAGGRGMYVTKKKHIPILRGRVESECE